MITCVGALVFELLYNCTGLLLDCVPGLGFGIDSVALPLAEVSFFMIALYIYFEMTSN